MLHRSHTTARYCIYISPHYHLLFYQLTRIVPAPFFLYIIYELRFCVWIIKLFFSLFFYLVSINASFLLSVSVDMDSLWYFLSLSLYNVWSALCVQVFDYFFLLFCFLSVSVGTNFLWCFLLLFLYNFWSFFFVCARISLVFLLRFSRYYLSVFSSKLYTFSSHYKLSMIVPAPFSWYNLCNKELAMDETLTTRNDVQESLTSTPFQIARVGQFVDAKIHYQYPNIF